MTKQEAIREVCAIVAMAYQSIADYTYAGDGFCDRCPHDDKDFRNDGKAIEFVRLAVLEKLKRDGVLLHPSWTAEGKEIE